MIAPKGTSFDNFTQETVNMIFSHVNAVKRNALNGKSAYEVFCFTYSSKIAEALGIVNSQCKFHCGTYFGNSLLIIIY